MKRTLKLLDELAYLGIEFTALSDNYWLHQNARIQTGKPLILPNYALQS